ncbi:MAG TPA: hypothetical protein VK149_06100 [Sideroxyarcus sp.]|nr:hypothetical protein [Sideroxyarcus sp.]
MLRSVRNLDKKSREAVLADLAIQIARPSTESFHSLEYRSLEAGANKEKTILATDLFLGVLGNNDNQSDIAIEILQKLKLENAEYSPEVQSKLLDYLGREIRSLAIESGDIAKIRKRLGQKGVLPPQSYKVAFTEEFLENCAQFDVTKKEVTESVHFPDMAKHFFPEVTNKDAEAISLYAKTYSKSSDPYSLLVDTRRVNDSVYVHFALKIYHSDIDIEGVNDPIGLLKAFTEKFGAEFSLNEQSGKLILYTQLDRLESFRVRMPVIAEDVIVRMSRRRLADGGNEISIAYGVAKKPYIESITRHKKTNKQT